MSEMNHEIFFSYATERDGHIANTVCRALEEGHLVCWIAPRDILPGTIWDEAITNAIEASRIVILILSEGSNNSTDVAKEIKLAGLSNKIILPFCIENIEPSKSLRYYLGHIQRFAAWKLPLEQHLEPLREVVYKLLKKLEDNPEKPCKRLKRTWMVVLFNEGWIKVVIILFMATLTIANFLFGVLALFPRTPPSPFTNDVGIFVQPSPPGRSSPVEIPRKDKQGGKYRTPIKTPRSFFRLSERTINIS
jgi:hypothetical protein